MIQSLHSESTYLKKIYVKARFSYSYWRDVQFFPAKCFDFHFCNTIFLQQFKWIISRLFGLKNIKIWKLLSLALLGFWFISFKPLVCSHFTVFDHSWWIIYEITACLNYPFCFFFGVYFHLYLFTIFRNHWWRNIQSPPKSGN